MDKNFPYIEIEEKGKKYCLDRTSSSNNFYIINCATLSLHKAIIGITELSAIESASKIKEIGELRISKAVNTYYIVYHIFVTMMLLNNNYNIKLPKRLCKDGYVKFRVSLKKLNSKSELPNSWNESRILEEDISTLITHSEIKKYCEDLRSGFYNIDSVQKILFETFVFVNEELKNLSIKCLYEKICYIRDRVIYRPSNVIDLEGNFVQTSLDIRKEIENLPSSQELFTIIKNLYIEMIKISIEDESSIVSQFSRFLWFAHVEEEKEYLYFLDYNDNEIEKIRYKHKFPNEELSLPSYLSNLIELADKERVLKNIEDFWEPLFQIYKQKRKNS